MNEAYKKAIEFIYKETRDIEKEIALGLDKIKTEGAINSLEWNRLEGLADLELRISILQQIDQVFCMEEKSVDQMIEIFKEWRRRTVQDLTGDSHIGGSICGPWDHNSASPGTNRLIILKANSKRYEIKELKRVINMLEQ